MVAVRHLEYRYLKYAYFNLSTFLQPQSAYINAKYRRDRMTGSGYIANLRFLIWRPSAILNCANMLILTFRIVCGPNLQARAKFRRDQTNGC